MYQLPKLPYAKTDLAGFLSEEQMTFHYEKHHKAYIYNLNNFAEKDPLVTLSCKIELERESDTRN